jgi:L-2-hydroxycarboxylate dehydrogenase (NAD+)
MSAVVVDARRLCDFATIALERSGACPVDAALSAQVLVAADLAGVDSHGVARLRRYVEGLRDATIDGAARPEVIRERGGVMVIDGHNGLGQPTLAFAVDEAVERARAHGVAAALVRRSNHIGIAGWFSERAARAGMVALVTTNATPQVAPTGGAEALLGTDPISYAVPGRDEPICFDAATSIVPRGKLERLSREGRPMQPGWALGPDGQTATDVDAVVAGLKARQGYALLPLGGLGEDHGGHKGFGLGLLVELLCGPLAGASWSRHTYGDAGANLGQIVVCLDIGAAGEPGEVLDAVDTLAGELRRCRPADPDTAVRLPGDRRRAVTIERTRTGIPLPGAVVADLAAIAATCGIPGPDEQECQ